MPVAALDDYDFPVQDLPEQFPAPLLYIGWEEHLMFCAPFCLPLPPQLPFAALGQNVLPGVYGWHPDFARIDWAAVQWFKNGEPWQPDANRSLADNGLRHKDVLRLRSPGLHGIAGSGK